MSRDFDMNPELVSLNARFCKADEMILIGYLRFGPFAAFISNRHPIEIIIGALVHGMSSLCNLYHKSLPFSEQVILRQIIYHVK